MTKFWCSGRRKFSELFKKCHHKIRIDLGFASWPLNTPSTPYGTLQVYCLCPIYSRFGGPCVRIFLVCCSVRKTRNNLSVSALLHLRLYGIRYRRLEDRGIINSGVRPISNRKRMRAIVWSSVISHRGAKVTITPDIHYKFTCYRWVALYVSPCCK